MAKWLQSAVVVFAKRVFAPLLWWFGLDHQGFFALPLFLEHVQNEPGLTEGDGQEGKGVQDLDFLDGIGPYPGLFVDHVHQFFGGHPVGLPLGDKKAGLALLVHEDVPDRVVIALVEFVLEGVLQDRGKEVFFGNILEKLRSHVPEMVPDIRVQGFLDQGDDLSLFLFDDLLDLGHTFLADGAFGHPLDEQKPSGLGRSDEGDRGPFLAGPPCPSDTMDVGLRVLRQGVVDHMGQVVDVYSPGSDVRGHEDGDMVFLEFGQDLFPLHLGDIPVQSFSIVSPVHETSGGLVHVVLGPAEDDPVEILGHVDDPAQGLEFVALIDLEIDLVGQVRGHLLVPDRDHIVFPHVFFGDGQDFPGHGRGEEQGGFVLVRRAQDRFDILDKAHVEHLVGLVEDEVGDVLEAQGFAVEMVQNPARRTDNDIHSLAQPPELVADGLAPIDGHDPYFFLPLEGVDLFGHLDGQFTCRCEHDGLDHAEALHRLFDDRQTKGGGLSGARLGLTDEIPVPCKEQGDGLLLDGGRFLEPFFDECADGIVGKAQGSELC